MTMTSYRPYMIRALNEWILENQCTPYILVNAFGDGVEVPQDYVKDGQIVLNISPMAVRGLMLGNEALEFDGRFGGIPMHVTVPTDSVLGIYAKENGQGMIFDTDSPMPDPPAPDSPGGNIGGSRSGKSKKPSLKVVK